MAAIQYSAHLVPARLLKGTYEHFNNLLQDFKLFSIDNPKTHEYVQDILLNKKTHEVVTNSRIEFELHDETIVRIKLYHLFDKNKVVYLKHRHIKETDATKWPELGSPYIRKDLVDLRTKKVCMRSYKPSIYKI